MIADLAVAQVVLTNHFEQERQAEQRFLRQYERYEGVAPAPKRPSLMSRTAGYIQAWFAAGNAQKVGAEAGC